MPVDRSLLPPLPGKPDWYVEDAPRAVDHLAGLAPGELAPPTVRPSAAPVPVLRRVEPVLVPVAVAAVAEPFASEPHGRGKKRMKAFAGRFRG